MVAMYARNSAFLWRECSFANEYAAKLLVRSCRSVTTMDNKSIPAGNYRRECFWILILY